MRDGKLVAGGLLVGWLVGWLGSEGGVSVRYRWDGVGEWLGIGELERLVSLIVWDVYWMDIMCRVGPELLGWS